MIFDVPLFHYSFDSALERVLSVYSVLKLLKWVEVEYLDVAST